MFVDSFNELKMDVAPSVVVAATIGLLLLSSLITFSSTSSEKVLSSVPELKGALILGATPGYFRYGVPHFLSKLIGVSDEGISFANIFNNFIVSVHEPAMVREVLGYSEEVASR